MNAKTYNEIETTDGTFYHSRAEAVEVANEAKRLSATTPWPSPDHYVLSIYRLTLTSAQRASMAKRINKRIDIEDDRVSINNQPFYYMAYYQDPSFVYVKDYTPPLTAGYNYHSDIYSIEGGD